MLKKIFGDAFYDLSCSLDKLKKRVFKTHRAKANTLSTRKKIDLVFVWSVLTISILNLIVFWVYVNLSSFDMAFKSTIGDEIIYGFQNFKAIVSEFQNPLSQIRLAVKNTFIFFFFGLFVSSPITYILSYFLFKRIWLYKAMRFIYYLPVIISAVVLTSFYKYSMAPQSPVYEIWFFLTGDKIHFFANSDYTLKVILFYNLWSSVGAGTVIYVASFARISSDVLEYARIDGVNGFQEVIYFLFPLTWPMFSTLMFLSFTTMLSASGPILLFTQGSHGTMTLDYWLYANTIDSSKVNLAAAMGLVMTCINLPVAVLFKSLANRVENIEY